MTVTLRSNDATVGTVTLSANGEQTRFRTHFDGLRPNLTYRLTLHGGTCEQPGASTSPLLTFSGDGAAQDFGAVEAEMQELF